MATCKRNLTFKDPKAFFILGTMNAITRTLCLALPFISSD